MVVILRIVAFKFIETAEVVFVLVICELASILVDSSCPIVTMISNVPYVLLMATVTKRHGERTNRNLLISVSWLSRRPER